MDKGVTGHSEFSAQCRVSVPVIAECAPCMLSHLPWSQDIDNFIDYPFEVERDTLVWLSIASAETGLLGIGCFERLPG